MNTESCKLYSRDFEYFCQISSKSIVTISSYTVSKLGRFLETQCRTVCHHCHGSVVNSTFLFRQLYPSILF